LLPTEKKNCLTGGWWPEAKTRKILSKEKHFSVLPNPGGNSWIEKK
jgi:hypothetical protein